MKTKETLRVLTATITLLFVFTITACVPGVSQTLSPEYYSPLKNAQFVSKDETILVRYGPELAQQDVAKIKFDVSGSKSGAHPGQTILADDHQTVIFKPESRFIPGETVTVKLNSLRYSWQTTYSSLDYTFTVALNQQPGGVGATAAPPPSGPPASAFPNFLTVPQDIPHFTVNAANTSDPAGGD